MSRVHVRAVLGAAAALLVSGLAASCDWKAPEPQVAVSAQALTSTVTLQAQADAIVKATLPYRNYGTSSELKITGSSLASWESSMVRFDSQAMVAAVAGDELVQARLELVGKGIDPNWGFAELGAFRMNMPWVETGASWVCSNDTDHGIFGVLFNNCSSANRWGMEWWNLYPRPFDVPAVASAPAPSPGQVVSLDVTADVQSVLAGQPHHGWLLGPTQDWLGAWMTVHSREAAAGVRPRLVLTLQSASSMDASTDSGDVCVPSAGTDATCDAIDDDCDGQLDDDYLTTCVAGGVLECVSGAELVAQCDDTNACNGQETCVAGACLAGTAPVVDDGNSCTADACDPGSGVSHVALSDGAACSDGDACTNGDACGAGVCSGTITDCDGLSAGCTIGVCDPANGQCHDPAARRRQRL